MPPVTRQSTSVRLALLALFLLAAPLAAAEQLELEPAPFGNPPIGTRITWADTGTGEDRRTIVITGLRGMLRQYKRETGESVAHYLFCIYCARAEFDVEAYATLWPLEVGKQVELGPALGPRVWWNVMQVVSTERVTVPAGTFDTYVVRVRSWDQISKRMTESTTYYAPKLGWGVKYLTVDTEGNRRERSVVAIEYPRTASLD